MEHLLNAYSYNEILWKYHVQIFGHRDMDQTSMKLKMEKMEKEALLESHPQPSLADIPWIPALGMWKERNGRIFKGEKRTVVELWGMIIHNI